MSAKSPETDLYFVSNTNTARGANMTIDLCEISGRKDDLPTYAGHCFRDERGSSPAFHLEAMQNLCDVAGILGAEVELIPSVNAAVIVGNRRHVNPRFAAPAAGATKLIGADVNQRVGVSVVCML